MDQRLVPYACSLHASTDFREKLYKVLQNAAKMAALRPGVDPRVGKAASMLSQSRGIFKVLKWVNNLEGYQNALDEQSPVLRRLKILEAYLNTVVTMMQDVISINKLCGTNLVSERFVWAMNFLDLLLSLLLATLAGHALHALSASGANSSAARRKMLLLRLELGVRLADAVQLLEETSVSPSRRRLWAAPSPHASLLAAIASATFATSAVAIKRWVALPAPKLIAEKNGNGEPAAVNGQSKKAQ